LGDYLYFGIDWVGNTQTSIKTPIFDHNDMTNKFKLIVGLGKTGFSCAQYFFKKNIPIRVVDTRHTPPGLKNFFKLFPDSPLQLGSFPSKWFEEAEEIIVNPGVSLKEKVIANAIKAGKSVVGDIELFAREAKKPIVAITGSNGKSTVTSLMGEMIHQTGLKAAVGGNIGKPALDLLEEKHVDFYVLELSSFQLETSPSLKTKTAVILNVSEDHMDRYETFEDYLKAKQAIYKRCEYPVINMDEEFIWKDLNLNNSVSFSIQTKRADFTLLNNDGELFLMHQEKPLLNLSEMKLKGKHNAANALAALALGFIIHLPLDLMIKTLKDFKGLPHRCEWVRELKGIHFYNDSKGTNVGATIAAIEGLGMLGKGKRIILIAGGQGKGADFSMLNASIEKYAKTIVLIGEDAPKIQASLKVPIPIQKVSSLKQAVELAYQLAKLGDVVLLSPACASFDMFKHFEDRGDQFKQLVLSYT